MICIFCVCISKVDFNVFEEYRFIIFMFQTGLYPNSSLDVDSQTESNHDTALTLACAGGHSELVSLLLAKGADIEHRDKKGS